MKILIVDDDVRWSNVAAAMLSGVADRVLFSTSLKDAKERISKPNGFDVVVLDLVLPDSAARETLEQIPEINRTGRKVVVVSGYVTEDIRKLAQARGARDCLFKGSINFARELRACVEG